MERGMAGGVPEVDSWNQEQNESGLSHLRKGHGVPDPMARRRGLGGDHHVAPGKRCQARERGDPEVPEVIPDAPLRTTHGPPPSNGKIGDIGRGGVRRVSFTACARRNSLRLRWVSLDGPPRVASSVSILRRHFPHPQVVCQGRGAASVPARTWLCSSLRKEGPSSETRPTGGSSTAPGRASAPRSPRRSSADGW